MSSPNIEDIKRERERERERSERDRVSKKYWSEMGLYYKGGIFMFWWYPRIYSYREREREREM